MLGTANEIQDLPVILGTTNVIEEIGRQSLQVASLIHEYTKLPFIGNPIWLLDLVKSSDDCFLLGRTAKIQIDSGLKLHIEGCRKNCAALKDKFSIRIHLDTNKVIKAGLRQNGMFRLA